MCVCVCVCVCTYMYIDLIYIHIFMWIHCKLSTWPNHPHNYFPCLCNSLSPPSALPFSPSLSFSSLSFSVCLSVCFSPSHSFCPSLSLSNLFLRTSHLSLLSTYHFLQHVRYNRETTLRYIKASEVPSPSLHMQCKYAHTINSFYFHFLQVGTSRYKYLNKYVIKILE